MKKALACCIAALLLFACIAPVFAANADNGDTIVYITDYGDKYHRISCGSLWNSCTAITLESAVMRGYGRCARCHPPVFNGVLATPAPTPAPTPRRTPIPQSTFVPQAANPSRDEHKSLEWDGVLGILFYVAIFAAIFFTSPPAKKRGGAATPKKETWHPRPDSAPKVATELVYEPERPGLSYSPPTVALEQPGRREYTPYVYFSERGNVYHMGWCKYAQGMRSAPLDKVGNRRPCKVCKPPRRQ